jgi:PAS domain S-box-containing protein
MTPIAGTPRRKSGGAQVQRYIDELRLLQAIRLAVVATDVDGTVTFANEAAADAYACDTDTLLGTDVLTLVAADDADRPFDLAAVLRGETWKGDLTVRRPRGDTFVAAVSATPTRDAAGTVTGAVVVAEDMTEIREAEAEAAASEQRLRLAHDAAQLGSWHWDMASGVTVWDEQLEAIYGMPPGGFDGTFDAWVATLHPEDRDRVLSIVQEAVEARSSYVLRNRMFWPDGTMRWIEAHGKVTTDDAGNPTGTIGCVRDITDEMALSEREADSAARAALLQQVTAELSGAMTLDEVRQVLAASLQRVGEIVGAGVELHVPDDLTSITADELVAATDHPLSWEDAQLIVTLAAQCAITAERAQLHGRTLDIAEQLQSSLAASPLPTTETFDLAVHYAPGGDELEHVGGDWYDAVATRGGALALVVGDVMGRGVRAATTMIRVRAGIRGLLTVDPSPQALLTAADEMLARDAPDQFVTAVAVLANPVTGDLTLCNAGHVPVVLVRPDGRGEALGSGSGVPLGVLRGLDRASAKERIEPGTLIVLVTDGVVESRHHDLDTGIARLTERAAQLRDLPLQELVDQLADLADKTLRDDVTVVAARLS